MPHNRMFAVGARIVRRHTMDEPEFPGTVGES